MVFFKLTSDGWHSKLTAWKERVRPFHEVLYDISRDTFHTVHFAETKSPQYYLK